MIDTTCSCGQRLRTHDSKAGETIRCPTCGNELVVPVAKSEPGMPLSNAPPIAPVRSAINHPCPYCGSLLEVDGSLAGQEALCGACHERTIVPATSMTPDRYTTSQYFHLSQFAPGDRRGIKVPILISAISNVVLGVIWICTVICIPIGVPMVVLCIFEFVLYADADRLHLGRLIQRARTFAIFEIICGLLNWVSFVCGNIVLINKRKYQRDLTHGVYK
jgi:predicted RNA-binding Zn-ribbon protein involved in translation (DUF1610 family)